MFPLLDMRLQWTSLPSTLSSWLCLQLFLHLVFIQSGMLVAVMGLRLENITVPQSGIKGNFVVLGCEYRLDGDGEKLYSLKWYKENHEFLRYMPQSPNPITTFTRPGVQVDSIDYRHSRVVFKLKNLRLSSGGVYKCEISADAPTFKTLSSERNLSVIVLPSPLTPHLNFPRQVQLGERIRGNCTYSRSFPPAILTIYVNGLKVNNSEDMRVKMYEPQVDGVIEDSWSGSSMGVSSSNGIGKQYQYQVSSSSTSNLQTGSPTSNTLTEKTYTSVSGIEFRLDRRYSLQHGQNLAIRCVASVVDQSWETMTNITIYNYQAPQLSTAGQNRYSSGSEYVLPFQESLVIKTVRLVALIMTSSYVLC